MCRTSPQQCTEYYRVSWSLNKRWSVHLWDNTASSSILLKWLCHENSVCFFKTKYIICSLSHDLKPCFFEFCLRIRRDTVDKFQAPSTSESRVLKYACTWYICMHISIYAICMYVFHSGISACEDERHLNSPMMPLVDRVKPPRDPNLRHPPPPPPWNRLPHGGIHRFPWKSCWLF